MPNHLVQETSPYLQQHADNPVDWYPWGEEALSRARAQDKPILLSVGYSACHWCHVMAHESFEDADVAALMNAHYVNIKVDREERPDLDQIYQTAHHMLTQKSGGWPLTMFLVPDGTPFFGGTYFPKTPRYGMPGFLDLLPKIAAAYYAKRGDIGKQNAALMEALSRTLPGRGYDEPSDMDAAPLAAAVASFAEVFDEVHGGIGAAPKFPHPFELEFCLRRHARAGSGIALDIARVTLEQMAEGGIYDQLGGGFSRYSVDPHWTIPHFEKMLYDNGPLLALYSDAWRVSQLPLFKQVAAETAAWVMREMQSPQGGYYSSLDADSEHEEGKFYVWSRDTVKALVTDAEYAVIAAHYGIVGGPNFEGKYWHLRVAAPLAQIAQQIGVPLTECESRLASARGKLLAAREQRIWPGRDEKVLVSWNALMIRGMARAARVFIEPAWLQSAQRAIDFIRSVMWRDGRLLATYKDGKAHLSAYLDDHAFLLDALIELMQIEFRLADLDFAHDLAELLLAQFEDRARGGFFFVSHDHEKLIHRAKPGHDNATPSGNGVAAMALQRLGHLLGKPRYLAAAERTIRLFYPALAQHPASFVSLATALEEWLDPPQLVILRGAAGTLPTWQHALAATYRPHTIILGIPENLQHLPPALDKPAHTGPTGGGVSAWVCRGVSCVPPIADRMALVRALDRPVADQCA
jgi:uncharacterized protein YyaL (SSP411 family)